MFSANHFLWLFVCFCLIIAGLFLLKKFKVRLKALLTAGCIASLLSETVKVFSEIKLVPSADGEFMFPYISLANLPLHLCSLQIILIFTTRFMKAGKRRDMLLAFMYPTCAAGAFFALMLPTIFSSIPPERAFLSPHVYEFFLYHSFLIVLGLYIPISKQVDIKGKHFLSNMALLGGMAFISLYINSVFAAPVYKGDELISIEYVTNFLFTYKPPIAAIKLTEIWHWYIYLGVLILLATLLMTAALLPYITRDAKLKKGEKT